VQLHNKEEQVQCAAEPSGLSNDYNTLCVGSVNLAFSTTCCYKQKQWHSFSFNFRKP